MRIRLPKEIKTWLEEQAECNLRTQNNEIILALKARMAVEGEGLDSNTPTTAN